MKFTTTMCHSHLLWMNMYKVLIGMLIIVLLVMKSTVKLKTGLN